MIYPLSGMLLGLVLGMWRARAKGGTGFDMAQWGAVFLIIGGLLGLFILIYLERSYA